MAERRRGRYSPDARLRLLDRRRFRAAAEVRREVFSFIEGFYNIRRLHSAIGYQSPANFEKSTMRPETNLQRRSGRSSPGFSGPLASSSSLVAPLQRWRRKKRNHITHHKPQNLTVRDNGAGPARYSDGQPVGGRHNAYRNKDSQGGDAALHGRARGRSGNSGYDRPSTGWDEIPGACPRARSTPRYSLARPLVRRRREARPPSHSGKFGQPPACSDVP